ncbi:MAG: M20/M25/M40 family metallo-hydrolase [Phycisphaerales bacterium JB043]
MKATLDAIETRLCEHLASRARDMRNDLEDHVAIPTGKNHAPGLDKYREILVTRYEALGAIISTHDGRHRPDWLGGSHDVFRPPPTAVCEHPGKGEARILIACHLDTVFDPRGDFTDFLVSPDGDVATGPGVVDMKGGVLVALYALEALHACGVDAHWTVALTSDEETGSYASEHILRELARHHDVGIATEPAMEDGSLAIERMGSGQFMIEVHGRSAHVGRSFTQGISAVNELARILLEIERMPDPERGKIVSVGPIKGGPVTNAVPDYASAWGNARFPDRQIGDEIVAQLEGLATGQDAIPRVRVVHSFNRPAKPLIAQTEAFGLMAREVAESLGQELPFASTGGVCDGNILQDEGLPTIDTLGVRGGGLHTPDEWIELDSLVERAQLMAVLLYRLSTQGFSPESAGAR